MPPTPRIAYLTDVEGRWDKVEGFCEGNPCVRLDGEGLDLVGDGCFVYGGDAMDRGPDTRRLLRSLVILKQRYPERVVLLAGNRDINKLRLPRELGGIPRRGAPDGSRDEILRWTLEQTMGAGHAYAQRGAELGPAGDVAQSFLDDVAEQGWLWRYLQAAQLGFRAGETLFVHGAVTPENFGVVPGSERASNVDDWVAGLNQFYRGQLDAYQGNPQGTDHQALIDYQAPLKGTRANQTSVVYARPGAPMGMPLPLPAALRRELEKGGVSRLVLGHTPVGDCPAVVRDEGFEIIVADNAYSRLERGSLVVVGTETHIRGWSQVEGQAARVQAEGPGVGLRDAGTGGLIKGRLEDGRCLVCVYPGGPPLERGLGSIEPIPW